jgi:hypothetical protein
MRSYGVKKGWQVVFMLVCMRFTFSKPNFKTVLRAAGSMMAGKACVAFLVFKQELRQ